MGGQCQGVPPWRVASGHRAATIQLPEGSRFQPLPVTQWVMGRAVHGYKLSTIELGV